MKIEELDKLKVLINLFQDRYVEKEIDLITQSKLKDQTIHQLEFKIKSIETDLQLQQQKTKSYLEEIER